MEKSFEQAYQINVSGLKLGPFTDDFQVDDNFFSLIPESPIEHGQVQVNLQGHKYNTHIDAKFQIKGSVKVACDRCLELYDQHVENQSRIIYAFDADMQFEEDEEIVHISAGETRLSLVQEIYDFIMVSLPFRRVADPEVHQCDPAVLAYIADSDAPAKPETEEDIDPRWAALKKLKFDSNN